MERRRRGGVRQDVKGRRPRNEGEGGKDESLAAAAAAAAAAVAGCGGGRRRSSMAADGRAIFSALRCVGVALESLDEGRENLQKHP